MRTTNKQSRIEFSLAFLILLTASFDIFGVLNISGMTLRISQLFIVFAIVFICFRKEKVSMPKGTGWLSLWLLLQLIAALGSSNYKYSLGYYVWTVLSIGILFVFYNLFNTPQKTEVLLKMFVRSFVAMALLGMVQWILRIIGIDFYLTQPTLNGTNIPRLNGFNFEPSYYATYLLPGWVLVMYLVEEGSSLFTKRQLKVYAVLLSLALFLSTSRMGWIFMGLWFVFRGFAFLRKMMVGKLKKGNLYFFVLIVLCIAGVAIIAFYLIRKRGIDFLISGLGVGGSSDHSSTPRITSMLNTLAMIKESPLIGLSLGGLPVRFCDLYEIVPFDTGATMCVWAELLSASGILGTFFFATWFFKLYRYTGKNSKRLSRISREITGIRYALLFECFILALNQNFLRVYFWTLLGVVCVVTRYERQNAEHFIRKQI